MNSIIEKFNRTSLEARTQTNPVNSVIEEIYTSGVVQDAEGQTYQNTNASVTFQAGALLYDFVRAIKPTRTLEIGMAYGLSTLFVCQAHMDNATGSHTAIDPFQAKAYQSIGLLNIERANLQEKLRFLPTRSEEALPQLVADNEQFDFVFIDGSHLFDHVFVDFFFVDQLLEIGGYIAFDDIWMPAVRKAASFVLQNKPYELVRPPAVGKTPVWLRGLRGGRRILQNPLGKDWKLKFVPENIALFKKIESDNRTQNFHRAF